MGNYKWMFQLALVAALVGAAWWIVSPRIELQSDRADRAEQDLQQARELIDAQAIVLVGQQQELGRIEEIGRQMQALQQQVAGNARNQSREFEELKRNDKTIADYLGMPVPAGLGLLYARPETTDPSAYRSTSAVHLDPVPAAGATAAASE
tara:strand:+ start:7285 stop:7737 length:453 start_codon:yes stop_codon:yes gene_type:complete